MMKKTPLMNLCCSKLLFCCQQNVIAMEIYQTVVGDHFELRASDYANLMVCVCVCV